MALTPEPRTEGLWDRAAAGFSQKERSHLFQTIYPVLQDFCVQSLGWQTCPAEMLWDLWLPLAMQLRDWQQDLQRPLIQGILGGQGTGKTTLAAILTQILHVLGLQVCQISIDDLYKTYADRQRLQQADPRFRWRGPPGTHDVELGIALLQRLRQGQPVEVPRFDKSAYGGQGDRTSPEPLAKADVVLLEGWFVGVRPVEPIAFETAPPPIETEADRAFAREVNDRLQDYLPLWDLLDRLIVLTPTDYRYSKQWRREAEQRMIVAGKPGMTDAEIDRFVEYFWRSLHPELFITPLLGQSSAADYVIELNASHQPIQLYRPQLYRP
ncbi:MAG: glycerate kinase [Oscillatoriophycideae cyanobacterium NC_groundwater_1537_Pr4_S-0.65um_50_18]|nr:glycerate kinase [Oscillatoriophycideae cyanobacterium NC_groundwater_1537_Pr4_S-0.65um_50_18]